MDEDMRLAIQLSKQEQAKTGGGPKASLEKEFKGMNVGPKKKKGPSDEMQAMMMDTAGFNKLLQQTQAE